MKKNAMTSWASRIGFVAAFLLAALAVVEKIANLNGQTMNWLGYAPGRIFEFAALLLLFVIALQLRLLRRHFDTSD